MAPQQHHTSRVGVAQGAPGLAHMAMPPAIPHMLIPLECPMQHKIGAAAKTNYRLRCYKVQRSARRNNISLQRQMIPATLGHKSAVCASTAPKSSRARRPQQHIALRAWSQPSANSYAERCCYRSHCPTWHSIGTAADNPCSTPAQRRGNLPAHERPYTRWRPRCIVSLSVRRDSNTEIPYVDAAVHSGGRTSRPAAGASRVRKSSHTP